MTTLQATMAALLFFLFFGSIALGLCLRHDDERRFDMQEQAGRRLEITRAPEETLAREMQEAIDRYYAEVDRLQLGYGSIAVLKGEAAAQEWLREQTGPHRSNG